MAGPKDILMMYTLDERRPDILANPGKLNELSMDFVRGQGRAVEFEPMEIKGKVKKPGAGRKPWKQSVLNLEELDERPTVLNLEEIDERRRVRTPSPNEWRTRVTKASWRGVEFEIDSYTLPVGRKSFVHEYAQSDGIFVEDNGRETRYHKIQGFVHGDAYDLQRDDLVWALELEGPGDLFHPYYGLRRCRTISPCTVSENVKEQRIARFDMTFVDVDEGAFPREVTDFPATVQNTGLNLTQKSLDAADTSESLLRAKKPLAYLGAFSQFESDVESHVLTGLRLALEGTSFKDELATLLLTIFDVQLLIQVLRTWMPIPAGATPEETNAIQTLSTWARTEIENRAAVLVASTFYASYEEATQQARAVIDQTMIDEATVVDPGVHQDLIDLRVNLWRAVYELGLRIPREKDLEVFGPTPAIVLAWNLYEDPLRDEDIVARNNIEHPSFCAGLLRVLSR